ncbi:MAG: hypothetical protein ACK5JF_09780 [Oscillospiraceae bacterium]
MKILKKAFAFFVIGVFAFAMWNITVFAQDLYAESSSLSEEAESSPEEEKEGGFLPIQPRASYVYIHSSAGSGGSISPTGKQKVYKGNNATYTLIPSSGFAIEAVWINGVLSTDYYLDGAGIGTYTFYNVQYESYIVVNFKQTHFTISSNASGKGSISPSGATKVAAGDSQVYTLTPDRGYKVDSVRVNGAAANFTVDRNGVGTYVFSNVQSNNSITVTYKVANYTIQSSYIGGKTGGSINPSDGAVTVQGGDSKTYKFVPATGYRVKQVQVDGAFAGAVSTYTFDNINADHVISVEFEAIPIASSTPPPPSVPPPESSTETPPVESSTILPVSSSTSQSGSDGSSSSSSSESNSSSGSELLGTTSQSDSGSASGSLSGAAATSGGGMIILADMPAPAAFITDSWAWVNLALAAVAIIIAIVLTIGISRSKKKQKQAKGTYLPYTAKEEKIRLAIFVTVFCLALFSILTLLVIENFNTPMQMFNRWTPLMALYFALQIMCAAMLALMERDRKEKQEAQKPTTSSVDEDEEEENKKEKSIYRAGHIEDDDEAEPVAPVFASEDSKKKEKQEQDFLPEDPYGAEAGASFFKKDISDALPEPVQTMPPEVKDEEADMSSVMQKTQEPLLNREFADEINIKNSAGAYEHQPAILPPADGRMPSMGELDFEEQAPPQTMAADADAENIPVWEDPLPGSRYFSVPEGIFEEIPREETAQYMPPVTENMFEDAPVQQEDPLDFAYDQPQNKDVYPQYQPPAMPEEDGNFFKNTYTEPGADEVVLKEEGASAPIPYMASGVQADTADLYSPPVYLQQEVKEAPQPTWEGYSYDNWSMGADDKQNASEPYQAYVPSAQYAESEPIAVNTQEVPVEEEPVFEPVTQPVYGQIPQPDRPLHSVWNVPEFEEEYRPQQMTEQTVSQPEVFHAQEPQEWQPDIAEEIYAAQTEPVLQPEENVQMYEEQLPEETPPAEESFFATATLEEPEPQTVDNGQERNSEEWAAEGNFFAAKAAEEAQPEVATYAEEQTPEEAWLDEGNFFAAKVEEDSQPEAVGYAQDETPEEELPAEGGFFAAYPTEESEPETVAYTVEQGPGQEIPYEEDEKYQTEEEEPIAQMEEKTEEAIAAAPSKEQAYYDTYYGSPELMYLFTSPTNGQSAEKQEQPSPNEEEEQQ